MTLETEAQTSQSSFTSPMRWSFYRRLGLLLRTRLDAEGTTLSLSEIAARTRGRVSVGELTALLAAGPLAQPDAVTCVVLAQAFDVDPDFFVTDEAVRDYMRALRDAYRDAYRQVQPQAALSLQAQALAINAAREMRGVQKAAAMTR